MRLRPHFDKIGGGIFHDEFSIFSAGLCVFWGKSREK